MSAPRTVVTFENKLVDVVLFEDGEDIDVARLFGEGCRTLPRLADTSTVQSNTEREEQADAA